MDTFRRKEAERGGPSEPGAGSVYKWGIEAENRTAARVFADKESLSLSGLGDNQRLGWAGEVDSEEAA